MKTALSILCASLVPLPILAQAAGSSPAVPDPEPYEITEIGLDHRVWSRTSWEPAPDGTLVARTNSYTEWETSMYYLKDGRLEPSVPLIEGFPGGAVARQGPFKAIFANSLATRGAIDIELPDGQRLVSNPLCLMYYDWVSGSNAVIAQVAECQGVISGSNQVIYPSAFDTLNGSVRLTYTKAGIEQDIIIEDEMSLPPPEAFGIASESATLAAVTEFHGSPQPTVIPGGRIMPDGGEWPDVTLDFESARIGRGQAVWLGNAPQRPELPVLKDWLMIGQRRVLVEEIPLSMLRRQTPSGQEGASVERARRGPRNTTLLQERLPKLAETPATARAMEVASVDVGRGGLVLDYIILTGNTNSLVLEGDKTFFINGLVNVFGELVIEPGVVVKLPVSGTAGIVSSNVNCRATSYRPALFTAKDDASAGETISGSTGNPSGFYGKVALDLSSATAPVLRNLRFCYLSNAVAGSGVTLEDCQMVKCRYGFALGSAQPALRNALLSQVGTLLPAASAATLTLENVTAHDCTNLLGNTSGTVNLTNCLLAGVGSWQCTTTRTNATAVLSSGADIFQTAGGGAHYLAEGSPYRHAGTTNVNAGLLARLGTKTTYAPIVYSNATFDVEATLSPQAERCSSASPPIGYAYDALDFAFGGCKANQNLTFAPGTAAGWFRTTSGWYRAGHGINIADGKVVRFEGRPEAPDYWVRANTVQEGCNGLWQGGVGPGGITGSAWPNIAASPELVARFTRFSMLGVEIGHYRDDSGWLTVRATGCEFGSGQVASYNMRHFYTNCLWERSHLSMQTDWPDSGFAMRNCTMRGGGLSPYRFGNGVSVPVVIQDSAFDGTGIYNTAINTNVTYYNYNAFAQGADRISPAGANDVIVTNFNWQSGWLGNFYLPTNSPLIDTGSVTADSAGLSQYTTQVGQAKESTTQVDRGYHYPAAAKVAFVGTDTVTQGNWKGVYGTDGCQVILDAASLPAYAALAPSGKSDWTWNGAPAEARALQRVSTGRIAACWYGAGYYDIALTQTDNLPHRLAIYCMDWDGNQRVQTLSIRDSATGEVYDSRSVAGFYDGQYWVWDIIGNATIRVTKNVGANAVISGLFFAPGQYRLSDRDGDGAPDAEEDVNGNSNGVDDPTSWLIYNSPNGLSGADRLRVYTPLK